MLDDEEADYRFKDSDKDKDGKLKWAEIIEQTYGYKPKHIKRMREKKPEHMKLFLKFVDQDEKKFNLADLNKDGFLDREEFKAYSHPFNHEHMLDFEIWRSLEQHDTNQDGQISLEEFIGPGGDEKFNNTETQVFNHLDKNKDGVLDKAEIRAWLVPDKTGIAEEETKRLVGKSDANKDGVLSKEEILDQVNLFVGSQAVGPHIDRMMEDHDEL